MLRALAFSIFPLVAATTLLGRRRLALDRKALRGPFFSQCYLTAPEGQGEAARAVSVAELTRRAAA